MRVAIVDDAAVMRAIVASVARDLGHEVVASYASVADARAGLAAVAVDVVLLDGRIGVAADRERSARTKESDLAEIVRALDAACAVGRVGAPGDAGSSCGPAAIVVVAALHERGTVEAARTGGAAGVVLRPVTHGGLATALEAVTIAGGRASAT